MADNEHNQIAELTADIVSAYVANNRVEATALPILISTVAASLNGNLVQKAQKPEPLTPAVPIRNSLSPEAITCLECGKRQKLLKRHLGSSHGLDPQSYRQKWGLPNDYPMVALDYAEVRSKLARSSGLGRKAASVTQPEPAEVPPADAQPAATPKAASRTRRKKVTEPA